MKKFFQNNSIINIFSLTMIVLMFTFASVAHAQSWAPPTSNPPADNTPPPVNIAGQDQVKSGWLKTGSFFGDKKLGATTISATEFCLEPSVSLIEAWTHGGSNVLSNNASCVTNSTGWGTGSGTGINPGNTLGDTLYWDGTEWLPSNNFFNNAVFTAAFNFFLPGLSVGTSSALALCVEPDGQVVTCGTPPPPPPTGHPNFYGQFSTGNIGSITGAQVATLASVQSNDGTTNGNFVTFNGTASQFAYYAHPASESPVLISFNIGAPGGVGANWGNVLVNVPINGNNVSYRLYKKPTAINSTGTAYLKAD